MHRRPDTLDDFVINEVGCYEPLGMRPDDVVFDVGANIGAFTRLAAEAGVRKIVAFEPDPENAEQWRKNFDLIKPVPALDFYEAAVITDGGPHLKLPFFQNVGKNKGMHSLVPHRGRTTVDVRTVSWQQMLDEHQPTVLKIDIEGGEFGINLAEIPKQVRAIAIEIHLTKKGWREKETLLVQSIVSQGFKATVAKVDVSGKRWTTFYVFHREV